LQANDSLEESRGSQGSCVGGREEARKGTQGLPQVPGARAQPRHRSIIIEAAMRLLREKKAFSMHDAARVAGVSAASIYQYFPTQEALVAACEEHALVQLLSALAERSLRLHDDATEVSAAIEEPVRLAFVLFR